MHKRSAEVQAKNNQVEDALKDYRNKKYKSVNTAAIAHNVPIATLGDRGKKGKSRAEANEVKQKLSAAEEKALIKWILKVSQNRYPPHKSQLQEMAEDIRQQYILQINDTSITLVEYPLIETEGPEHFIWWDFNYLKMTFARGIALQGMKETMANTILQWLNTMRQTIEEYQVESENIYNINESEFTIGLNLEACIIVNV